jgi:hypothetical protein
MLGRGPDERPGEGTVAADDEHIAEDQPAARRIAPWIGVTAAAVVVLVVAGIVVVARRAGDDATTTDAGEPGAAATTAPAAEPPIGPVLDANWDGVRTDGSGLVVAFLGLPPSASPDDPCQADYRAVVDQSDTVVTVTVHGTHVDSCGVDLAVGRSLAVDLDRPLGDRSLVNGATERHEVAFDGSVLPEAGWLPDGWVQLTDQPADPHPPGLVTEWQVGWGPPRSGGTACGADVSPVTLTVGPASELLARSWVTSFSTVGSTEVGGRPAEQARYRSGPPEHPSDETMLRWSTGDTGYVVRSAPSCPGEPPADFALLQRLADGLS